MADLSDKVSESEEMSSRNPTPERGGGGTNPKTCLDCGTSKTPLWRGGPAGPKSLCNACGIRSRKKRRALLGINKEEKDKKVKKTSSNSSTTSSSSKSSTIVVDQIDRRSKDDSCKSNSSSSGENNAAVATSAKYGESLRKKLMAFGRDFVMQRPRSKKSNAGQRRKMGEVEQAAFLLMALSCGSVYA